MMIHRITLSIFLGLSMLACSSVSTQESVAAVSPSAEQTIASVVERYAPGSIASTEIANRALEDVRRERDVVESQFAHEEAACYQKFFVTSCMDAAKDRKRMALKQLRAIEVEANARNRRAAVEKKDQALSERQAKKEASVVEKVDAQDSGTQNGLPASAQDIADVENRSRQAAPSSAASAIPSKESTVPQSEEPAQQAKENAEARKRAENIKAFEKKQQRSLERQQKLAEKKKEKEKKQAQQQQP